MRCAVAYQSKKSDNTLRPGDVIVSNHPAAGGSHLPNVTVITPLSAIITTKSVLFWVASRGQHASIGGIVAGPMPPHSKETWQEGASFIAFKLVREGLCNVRGLVEITIRRPAIFCGCTGTRTWSDNVSDPKAQVAANRKGIKFIRGSIRDYWLHTTQVGFLNGNGINANERNTCAEPRTAPNKVSILLREVHDMQTVGYTNDGSKLSLRGKINKGAGQQPSTVQDRSRVTSHSTRAVLLQSEAILSEGTILSPSTDAATVGGNVEASQRVIDQVLQSLQASGASQETYNNLAYGYGGQLVDGVPEPGFG
ncbi:hypothetical protein ASPCAL04269 [Aspergillus calidoustus]|uniref:Hydantoinase B/oxoprolinase domain-containing protein n=1 Tax=Aspergillus calidoustus TaxID=454130 RepID=A0A0U5FY77_ASPCI|nr:hypothetical protein ASPCAL04269 [Aspergillus calidoustus]